MPQNPAVNASGGANEASSGSSLIRCRSCLKRFRADRRSQRYCSSFCRQLGWWFNELSKALQEGHAEGIRPRLEELGRRHT